MHIQKSVRLFLIVSVALGNTKSSGMQPGNAPYIEEGSKKLMPFRILSHNDWKYHYYYLDPITIQSGMADHIKEQIYNKMQQEGSPLPEGGFKLIAYGRDLLKVCNNDEELNKILFESPDSIASQIIPTVVPKASPWHPQTLHRQEELPMSFFSTLMSMIKNFE